MDWPIDAFSAWGSDAVFPSMLGHLNVTKVICCWGLKSFPEASGCGIPMHSRETYTSYQTYPRDQLQECAGKSS